MVTLLHSQSHSMISLYLPLNGNFLCMLTFNMQQCPEVLFWMNVLLLFFYLLVFDDYLSWYHMSNMDFTNIDLIYCDLFSNPQKTRAYHRMKDDVPEEVKQRRLREMITVCRDGMGEINATQIGTTQLVLVEGVSIIPFKNSPVRTRYALSRKILSLWMMQPNIFSPFLVQLLSAPEQRQAFDIAKFNS